VPGLDPTSPERVSALVAPVLDRLRVAIADRLKNDLGLLLQEVRLDVGGATTMAMLRNTVPDRAVTRDDVRAVFRYMAPAEVDAGVASALAAGVLGELPDGRLRATAQGQALLARLYAAGTDVVARLWAGHEARVQSLSALAARAVDAATATGGPAFAVLSPPHEPAGAPAAMLLAERLTPLRFHRFDAHVAAWQAAGLTVDEVKALGPGPVRDAIEQETNRLAAPPYAALDASERVELIAGLGALPN
jgi:hypothetical protein